jgi:UDP-N-acetylglucosamine--N-acetylmuramyl-(pentapeptide) pyrophosphoryl-undecaprenol N-acetylglucosamine transferase
MQVLLNLIKIWRGVWTAFKLGRKERPEALFVTGGYASVPAALAAWLLRVPILLYLPDIEPGLAVRFIARLANRIGVTTEESRVHFPGKSVVVTGYPVRAEFHTGDRFKAREQLGLDQEESVLLVFGGSHGARSINQAVLGGLEMLTKQSQVVHISGELDWPWISEKTADLPSHVRERYHPYDYLHEMWLALASADLVVCRAGASILGELPFYGLPAVLVPYPHSWRYQIVNAQWLTDRGAAVWLADERLEQDLISTVHELFSNQGRLEQMSIKSQELARPDAAVHLAKELRGLAVQHSGGRA